jgi:hypothetical protein
MFARGSVEISSLHEALVRCHDGQFFAHFPTLVGPIMDFSLLEITKELCKEELPMLYTVTLRAVSAEIAQDEEEGIAGKYALKLADQS